MTIPFTRSLREGVPPAAGRASLRTGGIPRGMQRCPSQLVTQPAAPHIMSGTADSDALDSTPVPTTAGWEGGRAGSWCGHHLNAAALRADVPAVELVASPLTRRRSQRRLQAVDAAIRTTSMLQSTAVMDAGEGLTLEPLSPTIGTVIHGIDLAAPTAAQVAIVWQQVLARKVVFFRGQGHITAEQQAAFGECFGEVGLAYGESAQLSAHDSARAEKTALKADALLVMSADGDDVYVPSTWHSDATWAKRPPMASILLARQSTTVGGDTVFVDTAAVWAGLSPHLQHQLQSLRAVHGRPTGVSEGEWKGGAARNFRTISRSELRSVAEVSHPVMRTHPETRQPHLFVNPTFTLGLQGLPPAEGEALLSELYAKMYSTPEYTCRFRWTDGAVALWDNRSCQHYACGDFWPQQRKMERVTVLDAVAEHRTPY